MTTRFRFQGTLYASLFAVALAACGSSDDNTAGGTGGSSNKCAGKVLCYDLCTCTGKTPTECLQNCGSTTCGNGTIDTGEVCDGTNLGGRNCDTATSGAQPSGVLSCSSTCTFNLSGCTGGLNSGGAGGTAGGGGTGGGAGMSGGGGRGP